MKQSKLIPLITCLSVFSLTHAAPIRVVEGCTRPEIGVLEPIRSILDEIKPDEVLSDSTRMSILITVALNQKTGHRFKLQEVASAMNVAEYYDRRTLFDIQQAIRKLGYDAKGYRIENAGELTDMSGKIAFLVDRHTVPNYGLMALLFASTEQYKYLLYTNGLVCPIPTLTFGKQFDHAAILIVENTGPVKGAQQEPVEWATQTHPTH